MSIGTTEAGSDEAALRPAIANTVWLEAHARDGRTVVERMRTSGLCRASRVFREGAAARVVVSQLGPGMVRGDVFAAGGTVASGAHLIVAGQMATRVLSGPRPVAATTRWTVEPDAALELRAEPTLVCAGAAYATRTELVLRPGARAAAIEVLHREPGAACTAVLLARRGDRLVCADALRFAADDDQATAVGTLAIFGAARPAALDGVAGSHPNLRIGIGTLRDGDVLARVIGPSVWDVHAALLALREAAG